MYTVKAIKDKCIKYWDAQHIQRSFLDKTISLFPLELIKIRITSKMLFENFTKIREGLYYLQQHDKQKKGVGFYIRYQSIQHRQLGEQSLPTAIVFETLEDFLKFIGHTQFYLSFCNIVREILNSLPELADWLKENTDQVLRYEKNWSNILRILEFLKKNPMPGCYLRELPIPEVDTKFIEKHKPILHELLNVVLSDEQRNGDIQDAQSHAFEQRFGFKFIEPVIRFRILDRHHQLVKQYPYLKDLSLPLSNFQSLNLEIESIIITENKINGLAFPDIEEAIVIFGLGYGIHSLANIQWFKDKAIYYWGDIDTHGFAMLSQLRSYYPQVKSLLMDDATLQQFLPMAVVEPETKRCIATLPYLTPQEQNVYQSLCQNIHGEGIRIEQERIHFDYVMRRLKQILMVN